ncbi:leader peptidase (prepilin peptidase)/N-methyltransferase [Caldalkalibacillus uzonensis]|uniref:Leader peptidase (Prepilin peptidase)/N-methyltransferase n=1 Tax=Caldalkalibacillus uzonensis TaxID=353224 RepID=A0ABU0CST8_9BACI|nr:leader peptidase (prepilin peptidase)/N-methyltransferase [Caldalkalibacillus uzonensis]
MIFVTALFLGSFYNVLAIRLLKKQSFVYPPSHCPQCQHRLAPWDLVPLLSYLVLRGKCRYCQSPISPLYPAGELLTGLSLYLAYRHLGLQLELLPAVILISVLVLAVLTDLRKKLILDVITLPALVLLLVLRLVIGEYSFWFYLAGGLTGFGLLLLISIVSRGGMGGGDIKLYALIGVVLGPSLTLLSLVLASFMGALVGGVMILLGRWQRKETIPFAPFIFVGTFVAYFYGETVWVWYLQLW